MKMLRLIQEAKFIQNSKNKTEGLKCTEFKQIYKLISYKWSGEWNKLSKPVNFSTACFRSTAS